jgi:hypothetical protein
MKTMRTHMLVSFALFAVLAHVGAASAQLTRFEELSSLPMPPACRSTCCRSAMALPSTS